MSLCQQTRDQIANISWIIKKAREFQKNIYFCFTDYAKAFDCVDHNKLWKILKETGIPDHFICLLRNQYASQEATVRTGYGTKDWFQIGKGVHQGCVLSTYLFKLYAEYIMRNIGLVEAQAGINIAGRNINYLRYADGTTLMAESKELKSLLMKVGSEKAGLKLNIPKTKIMTFSPISSFQFIQFTCSAVSCSLQPHGLSPARLICPWDSPGKNTGVGLPFPPPGDLPDPGIKPASLASPALAGRFFTT